MTSTQIRYFLAAAKYLNFSEAARALYVAQSSLSRNISSLEAELGVQLFLRTKSTYVRLTPAGAVWVKEFETFQKLLGAGRGTGKTCGAGSKCRHSYRHDRSPGSPKSFLPKAISYLKTNYPEITISLMRGNFRDLREMLKNNAIDVALTLSFDVDAYKDQDIVYRKFL